LTDKRPRILFLTTSFPAPGYPASGIFIYHLVENLSKYCDIQVLSPDSDKKIGNISHAKNYHFRYTLFRYAPRILQSLFHRPGGLPAAVQNNKWKIMILPLSLISMAIHILRYSKYAGLIHANWSLTAVVALFVRKIYHIPVIVTFRGSDISLGNSSYFAKLLIRISVKYCEQVICISKALKTILIDQYNCPIEKISVIPNGISDEFINLSIKQNFSSPVRLMFIGNLTKNKSVDVILKSLGNLKAPDFLLTIIGSGPEESHLTKLSNNLGISSNVRFLGHLPPEEIPDLLQDSDIFVFSSKAEGRPNVILEAMAAGKPVIASNIQGINDLISDGNTGLLYTYGNTTELHSRIIEIIDNPELAHRLGQRARQHISDLELTWDCCAKQYLELYKQIGSSSQSQFE